VANDFYSRVLEQYRRQRYDMIRPVHGALLRNLGLEGSRVVELARRAGITHRAMTKIADDLSSLGVVTRRPDPRDRRATLVVLTPFGLQLLRDSSDIVEAISREYFCLVGARRMAQLEIRLLAFMQALQLDFSPGGLQALHHFESERVRKKGGAYLSHDIGRYLQVLGDDYHERCAGYMKREGFPEIRFDHLSVLGLLPLAGARLSALAESANISLQAMGEQARKVERMGYVSLNIDPADKRARLVNFTRAGVLFLESLVAVFDKIEQDYCELAGKGRLQRLRASLERVIQALGLEVPAPGLDSAT